MKKLLLRAKILEAEQQITLAEEVLAAAIGELQAVPRAEKTVSSGAIESAFQNLRASRIKVSELKQLLDDEESV